MSRVLCVSWPFADSWTCKQNLYQFAERCALLRRSQKKIKIAAAMQVDLGYVRKIAVDFDTWQ